MTLAFDYRFAWHEKVIRAFDDLPGCPMRLSGCHSRPINCAARHLAGDFHSLPATLLLSAFAPLSESLNANNRHVAICYALSKTYAPPKSFRCSHLADQVCKTYLIGRFRAFDVYVGRRKRNLQPRLPDFRRNLPSMRRIRTAKNSASGRYSAVWHNGCTQPGCTAVTARRRFAAGRFGR